MHALLAIDAGILTALYVFAGIVGTRSSHPSIQGIVGLAVILGVLSIVGGSTTDRSVVIVVVVAVGVMGWLISATHAVVTRHPGALPQEKDV